MASGGDKVSKDIGDETESHRQTSDNLSDNDEDDDSDDSDVTRPAAPRRRQISTSASVPTFEKMASEAEKMSSEFGGSEADLGRMEGGVPGIGMSHSYVGHDRGQGAGQHKARGKFFFLKCIKEK